MSVLWSGALAAKMEESGHALDLQAELIEIGYGQEKGNSRTKKRKKHVKVLRLKICAHKFYRLKSDTFESDRDDIGTCIGTTGINWDHPAQTERVVTVPKLDFQVLGASSVHSAVGSMLHNSMAGWLLGFFAPGIPPKLLSTLSFFFFF